MFQRLNALGANDGKQNMRTAIAAESGRNTPAGKLPVIPKELNERKVIEDALLKNAFMRGLSRAQFDKVNNHIQCFNQLK